MPDLGPAFAGLLELFGPIIGAALKALLRTVFGMVLLGVCVTGATVYFAAQGSWTRGAIAAGLSLIALVIVTGMLAVKNAVGRGLLLGLEKLSLGKRVLTMVFNRIGVTDESDHADRAGAAGRLAEKLPLREAEEKLTNAVNGMLAEGAGKGGVRGWMMTKLLNATLVRVQALTLTRFRSDTNSASGIDLRVIRDELAGVIDGKLSSTVASKLNLLNLMIAGVYVLFSITIALLLPRIMEV
jgi:hypothetical protein